MLAARRRYTPATQRPARPEPLRRGWHVASLEKYRGEFLEAKAFSTRRGTKASPETLKSYKTALRSFENHVVHETGADRSLDFTGAMVTGWLRQLDKRGLSRKAMSSYQTAVREFATWGLKRGYWRIDPLADVIVIRPPKGLPRPFTTAERDALFAVALDAKEAALRGVLYYLALRDATICRLTLGDITGPQQLGERVIYGTIWTLGKGSKEGVKPLHPKLWALLLAYDATRAADDKKAESFLFANGDGSPWHPRTIRRRVHGWGTTAGVALCTPHRFRHTAATDLLTRTNDITKVQKLLGHASLHTTQIYAEVVDQQLADAVATLPDLGAATPALDSRTAGTPGADPSAKAPIT